MHKIAIQEYVWAWIFISNKILNFANLHKGMVEPLAAHGAK